MAFAPARDVVSECVGAEPLTAEQLASTEGAEELRSSVDGAMRSYAAEKLPGAVVTTYGHKSGGACKVRPGRRQRTKGMLTPSCRLPQVTCCVGRCNMNLANYWAGGPAPQ